MKFKSQFRLALLLFLFFSLLRLIGIFSFSIQVDEHHWRTRSLEVLNRLAARDYKEITSHLGQPGAPPTLIMASGIWLAKKLQLPGTSIGSLVFDHLHSARISCALFSSLIVFPMFFLGQRLLELRVVILAILFLALEPHHVGLSRMAHLDSIMSVFVVSSVLFYFVAQNENRKDFKIYAGFFWGLAIATKPTAAPLVIAFLLFNVLGFLLKKIPLRQIIQVTDLWAVLIGLLTFSSVYTRLWRHDSDYYVRLKIESWLADMLYQWALTWQPYWPYHLVFLILSFVIVSKYFKIHPLNSLFLWLVSGIIFIWIFPQVSENMVRFWTWAIGLSSETHEAYGHVKEAAPLGYFGIILRDLPPIIFFGMLLGALSAFYKALSAPSSSSWSQVGFILTILIWTLILSSSSKQTLRYLLPVYCLGLFVASQFFMQILDLLKKFVLAQDKLKFKTVYGAALLLPVFLINLRYSPDQLMYKNELSSVVIDEYHLEEQSYLVGLNDAYRTIKNKIETGQKVYVAGDLDVMKLTQQVISHNEKKIKFTPPSSVSWGHLVIRFHSYDRAFRDFLPANLDQHQLLYRSKVNNIDSISVYKMALASPNEKLPLRMHDFYKTKGVLQDNSIIKVFPEAKEICPETSKCIATDTKRISATTLLFGVDPFFDEGDYEFAIEAYNIQTPDYVSTKNALRFKVGACERLFTEEEITNAKDHTLLVPCHFSNNNARQISLYWFGRTNLVLKNMSVTKKLDSLTLLDN